MQARLTLCLWCCIEQEECDDHNQPERTGDQIDKTWCKDEREQMQKENVRRGLSPDRKGEPKELGIGSISAALPPTKARSLHKLAELISFT